ncbi:hypothetical protein HJ590_15745 [Naumannella sp. ID2617S]|nr:hypothetical protein [Naumannella sp. ID2617S]
MPPGAKALKGFIKPLIERLLRLPKNLSKKAKSLDPPPKALPKPKGIHPDDVAKVLDPKRLQHGTRHLSPPESNVLPKWAGKTSPKAIEDTLGPVLTKPDRVFPHKLGNDAVTGYAAKIDGKDVVVFVYDSGKNAGKLATAVHPTPQQMINWGL